MSRIGFGSGFRIGVRVGFQDQVWIQILGPRSSKVKFQDVDRDGVLGQGLGSGSGFSAEIKVGFQYQNYTPTLSFETQP